MAPAAMPVDEGLPPEPFDAALPTYYSAAPDWPRYRALTELGARAGDPLAEYAMATWFMYGHAELGIRPHATRWIPLLTRAARSLNRAMYDLAIAKLDGHGMPVDRRGAYRLFARAAALGSSPALGAQAWCLLEGVGVRRDSRRGELLVRRARRLASQTQALTAAAAAPRAGGGRPRR